MIARVTTSVRSPADEAKQFIEEYAIPSLQKDLGFRGAFFLADRRKEIGISITLWEDADAAEASEVSSTERRTQAARMTGAILETADSYEVLAYTLTATGR